MVISTLKVLFLALKSIINGFCDLQMVQQKVRWIDLSSENKN